MDHHLREAYTQETQIQIILLYGHLGLQHNFMLELTNRCWVTGYPQIDQKHF